MERKHEFYPMLNRTMKTLICLIQYGDEWKYLNLITQYPHYELDGDLAIDALAQAIINELDRQYSRWNKGGDNAIQNN